MKKPKILYICDKILLLSSICDKCGSEDEVLFKEEDSIEILKVLGLITNVEEYQKIEKSISKYIIMLEENISQEFRLKNINETRSYLIEETNKNELMSKKHKKFIEF